jgi:mono/diheme cytochrome c family protein
MKTNLTTALTTGIILGFAAQGRAQEMGDAKKGATLAQTVCAECHTVDVGQTPSPNTRAPSFVTVAKTRGMTELALRVWLQSPHPTMPNLLLTDEQKDDVIAYLLSLKYK